MATHTVMAALPALSRPTPASAPPHRPGSHVASQAAACAARRMPGVLLCAGVTLVAAALERIEIRLAGAAWLETLVLAILAGTAIRSIWAPAERWAAGIAFSAKYLLEAAVVLLGTSVSARMVLGLGPCLLLGIAAVVVLAIAGSYGIGRLAGLPHRMSVLVACGNSICGNSAIAAVAPVIGAEGEDVASSIAFTAVLGVAVVLALPLTADLLHLSGRQSGALAGLTVYAVPQVLAAAASLGGTAVQIGTVVKLVRVLMLGPVVLGLSLLAGREAAPHLPAAAPRRPARPPLHLLAPWFIAGFALLAGLRSAGAIPTPVLAPIALAANALTVISMAALGLGTDLRAVARSGGRVAAVVTASLLLLAGLSLGLIRLIGMA